MKIEEALGVLALAKGKFRVLEPEEGQVGARVKYTGTDPEDEGRVLEALLAYARHVSETVGGDPNILKVNSLETDNVYLASDIQTHTAYEGEK